MREKKTPGKKPTKLVLVKPPAAVVEYDEVTTRTVAELVALYQESTVALAFAAGKKIVANYFGGDIDAVRRQGPKPLALYSLANHPDLPMKEHELYTAVRIFEMLERIGPLPTPNRLTVSHLEAVLPAYQAHQPRLIAKAVEQNWQVRQVRRAVAAVAEHGVMPKSVSRKPPVVSTIAKTVEAAVRQLVALEGLCGKAGVIDGADFAPLLTVMARLHAIIGERERQHANGGGGGGYVEDREVPQAQMAQSRTEPPFGGGHHHF